MSNYIKTLPLALFLLTGLASADQVTYTMSGSGSGYFGSQQFTNAQFTFTETADVSTIINPTTLLYETQTWKSTLQVSVAGFPTTAAVSAGPFVDQGSFTAGIWKDASTQFLTVTNAVFANYALSTDIGPVSGTTYAYSAPLSLTTGQQLYFTSVSGVTFTSHRIGTPGTISAVSMTPASGNVTIGAAAPQTYTFTFADNLGPADIQGVDILFSNPGSDPDACWVNVNLTTQLFSVYNNGTWSTPAKNGGSPQSGDECVVDLYNAGWASYPATNQLTVTIPVTFTPNQSATNTWPVFAVAFNQDDTSGYQNVGTVNVSPASQPGFTLTATPTTPQALTLESGSTVSYTINVVPTGGFNSPVSFSQLINNSQNPNEFALKYNPETVTGAGSTTLTVTTTASSVPASGHITVFGQTPDGGWQEVNTGNIYVANAAPAVAVSPAAGSTATSLITVNATDPADARDVNSLNLLIAPTLDGTHACWVYSDGASLWLATDDATAWMYAGALGSPTTASNSQCTIGGKQGFVTPSPIQTPPVNTLSLAIPVTFQPSFAGGKTVWVRASNLAGFDSGYQSLGTWTAP